MEDGFLDQYSASNDAGIGTVYSCRYSKQKKLVQNTDFLSSSACISNGKIQLYGIFSGFNGGDATAKFVMNRMVYEIFQDDPVTASASSKQIRQGTTALIVLKINKDLYVVNCGCSLALAITNENAVPLNFNLHNKDNELEKTRIKSLGIDPSFVLNPTRAIGDLQRTHLYEEFEDFKSATGPPVISTPDVQHFCIDDSWQHIVLLSDGVLQNLKEVEVDDIPTEVFVRLSEDHTLTSTAQALADSFARKHLDAFLTNDTNCCISNKREEMTVIYVKLSRKNHILYETFDSAISTLETTPTPVCGHISIPYVDANVSKGNNYKKMKKLTLI